MTHVRMSVPPLNPRNVPGTSCEFIAAMISAASGHRAKIVRYRVPASRSILEDRSSGATPATSQSKSATEPQRRSALNWGQAPLVANGDLCVQGFRKPRPIPSSDFLSFGIVLGPTPWSRRISRSVCLESDFSVVMPSRSSARRAGAPILARNPCSGASSASQTGHVGQSELL